MATDLPEPAELATSLSVGRPASSRFAILICYAGLLVANAYSWTMTTSGFVGTQLLPKNGVIADVAVPHVVALFMQLGILAFYISMPFFTRRHLVAQLSATAAFIVLVGLTILFSLFSIVSASQQSNLVNERNAGLTQLNDLILTGDRELNESYTEFVDGLDRNAKRACQGFDETGVGVCGPIARANFKKSNEARERYGSRLSKPGRYLQLSAADFANSIGTTRANLSEFEGKTMSFNKFAASYGLDSKFAQANLQRARQGISSIESSASVESADGKGLVLAYIFSNLKSVLHGSAKPQFYLNLFISALPDLLGLLCGSLLAVHLSEATRAAKIEQASDEIEKDAKRYSRMAEIIKKYRNSVARARAERRAANIETAVDSAIRDVSN